LQADGERAMRESRSFASGEYLPALFAGDSLTEERRREVAGTLARLTGLPQEFVLAHRLRIDPTFFRKELLAEQGLICGRFDGRITGRDGAPSDPVPGFDPSYTAALGPLAATMNAYVREELGFENDLPYKVLSGVGPWKFDENTYASTAGDLARAMSKNPHLRVLDMTGRYDLAVPPDSMRYSVDHLEIAAEVRANISYADYASGHMMYLNLPDLEKLASDVAAFLDAAGQ
jgi:carboxypeptidase C (cathepsin A)